MTLEQSIKKDLNVQRVKSVTPKQLPKSKSPLTKTKKLERDLLKKTFNKTSFEIPQQVINKWNLEEISQCVCYQKTSNIELLYLIEQFLKQIKNLLFLDLNKNILDYYGKFDQILKEKQLNLGKFSYVEKLFTFYQENQDRYFFNLAEFERILSQLITKELCIHDYKIIVQFLEGFKNVRFVENFVSYLSKHH